MAVILVVPWGMTWAGPAHELKLATVIPDGTPWTKAVNDVARKIYQQTDENVAEKGLLNCRFFRTCRKNELRHR